MISVIFVVISSQRQPASTKPRWHERFPPLKLCSWPWDLGDPDCTPTLDFRRTAVRDDGCPRGPVRRAEWGTAPAERCKMQEHHAIGIPVSPYCLGFEPQDVLAALHDLALCAASTSRSSA